MRKILTAFAMVLAVGAAQTATAQNTPAQPPLVQDLLRLPPPTMPPVPARPVVIAEPPQPAPEVPLTQQAIGKWSGPMLWVSKDLLLLGRADRDADNTKLWFWSRAAGAFQVALPADLEPQNRPNSASICAGDGEVKWVGPIPPRQTGMPQAVPERQIFRLTVDPVTKESRFDSSQREQIISTPYNSISVDKNGVAMSGFYFVRDPACRMVSAVAMVEGLKRLPELSDVPGVYVEPVSGGNYVVSWDPRTMGPDGKRVFEYKYLLVSPVFTAREPQPEKAQSLINALTPTAYGKLDNVEITRAPDPPQYQLQLTLPGGARRAIATSPPGLGFGLSVGPDGCLVRINTAPRSRTPVIETILQDVRPVVRPAPPPAPGTLPPRPTIPLATLGPAVVGSDYSIIDLCSPENRKLLEAVK